MKTLCPHCCSWIDTKKEQCPICGGDLFEAIEPDDINSFITDDEKAKPGKKSIFLKWIIVLCVLSALAGLIGPHIYNEEQETVEKESPKLSKQEGDIYSAYSCLPPFDIEIIPPGADKNTVLGIQQGLYSQHIHQNECPNVEIIQKVGKRKTRLNNAAGWFYHPADPYRHSFISSFEGCYGRPLGPTSDAISLYIRHPDTGNHRQFFIHSGYTHYFELCCTYPAIPVDQEIILYGIDNERFNRSILNKVEENVYSFEVDEQTLKKMPLIKKFRIAMQIQDRKGNRYIIYRVYPLTKELIVNGEYQTPKSFDESCPFGMIP